MNKKAYVPTIELAKKKLREGDRSSAKQIAHDVVARDQKALEGWLILAGLSKPNDSLFYLRKAEKIAPEDHRVKQAFAWAESRISTQIRTKGFEQTQKIEAAPISQRPATENRAIVWLWAFSIILILTLLFLGMGVLPRNINRVSSHFSLFQPTGVIKPPLSTTQDLDTINAAGTNEGNQALNSSPTLSTTMTPTATPSPTATPTIIPDLYGCDMELRFTSGPLEGTGTLFSMIDRSYFYDKGDKFDTGKNTGVFYEDQRYLILHSGYQDGNLSNPLEIEFLRKYLELWGNNEIAYIEEQIQTLISSEMVWICNSQRSVNLRLAEVVRLSHQASNQLWLNPTDILQIIEERDGEPSEWIGDIKDTSQKSVYLGFCGWGPPEITQDRSIYYRYVLRFEIID